MTPLLNIVRAHTDPSPLKDTWLLSADTDLDIPFLGVCLARGTCLKDRYPTLEAASEARRRFQARWEAAMLLAGVLS